MPIWLQVVLWIVGGAVGLVVGYLLVMAGITLYCMATGIKPRGIEVTVDIPPSAALDSDFVITVTVKELSGRDRTVSHLDFGAKYVDGIVITDIEPRAAKRGTEPSLGTVSNAVEIPIKGGSTLQIRVKCRAAKVGDFADDVTVYMDNNHFRFWAEPARTVIRG